MRQDPLFIRWIIRCSSPEEVRRIAGLLRPLTGADALHVDLARAFPNGLEVEIPEKHRLGDSFKEVSLLPGPKGDPTTFRLDFTRLPAAARYWKDLMVCILQFVRKASPDVTITREYRDYDERLHPAEKTG